MANPTCKCYSKIAYRVTAEDIPEADPETFKEYDVYESCGLQVSTPKREFRPGHDAKFKSVLIKAFRNGGDFAFVDGGMLVHSDAMNEASKRGWEKFMTAAPAKKAKKAKATLSEVADAAADLIEKMAQVDVDSITDPTVEEKPVGFHPVQVRDRGTWYDGSVVSRKDGNVTVAFTNRKGDRKETTVSEDSPRLRKG